MSPAFKGYGYNLNNLHYLSELCLSTQQRNSPRKPCHVLMMHVCAVCMSRSSLSPHFDYTHTIYGVSEILGGISPHRFLACSFLAWLREPYHDEIEINLASFGGFWGLLVKSLFYGDRRLPRCTAGCNSWASYDINRPWDTTKKA